MAEYKSAYTGAQIDQGIKQALETTPITRGGTGATDAEKALANLGGALKWDLLWTNSAPGSNFSSQTITIPNLNKYNLFAVQFRRGTSYAIGATALCYVNDGMADFVLSCTGWNDAWYGLRRITFKLSEGSLWFDNSYNTNTVGNTFENTPTVIIPTSIAGTKI